MISGKTRRVMAVILIAAAGLTGSTVMAQAPVRAAVHVKDYHAFPNDGLDDAKSIQQALAYAKAHHIKTVLLDSGRYDLLQVSAPALNAYIGLSDYNGLHLKGALNNAHAPATWLVKKNPQLNNTILPPHARFDHCDDLTLENIVFDNNPQYASAGTVIKKDTNYIVVEVFDGLPAVDGMGCYTANIWDTSTRLLKQAPSLTFIDDVAAEKLYWQLEIKQGKRYMRMNSRRFAQRVAVGDGLSWHSGAQTMFQLAINYCNNLRLQNLLTVNIAGWGIQTMACKNIRATQVTFKANGRQLAVGPRDAWKINSCDGQITIDSMRVEGVRWDGQNVHSGFFHVKEKLAFNKIRVWKKFTNIPPFINDNIVFWNGANSTKKLAIGWQPEMQADQGVVGIIETVDSIPAFVTAGTLISVDAWDIDQYTLRNSSFKNIAGCAGVIKCSKALIQQVSYDHIMYPALVLGTEINTHNEATFPQDVLIRDCSFNACGWVARINAKGLIGIANSGTNAMAMGTITIDRCRLSNAAIGINAAGLKLLKITNSRFTAVTKPYTINSTNTGNVVFENNTGEMR